VLGSTLTGEFAALPPIPLGALPTGTGTITGGQIASAVNAQVSKLQLPLLGPILSTLTGGVQSALTSVCQIGMDGINSAAGTVQSGAAAVASGAQQVVGGLTGASGAGGSGGGASQSGPGSGGPAQASGPGGGSSGGAANSSMPQSNSPVLGGLPTNSYPMDTTASGLYQLLAYDLAESPSARYGGIPYATAGLFVPSPGVQYGGNVPGYNPQFGVLGQPSGQGSSVQDAGHADALHGPAGGSPVGLPLLLAVLALSGVTAALVRTWVLRRSTA
jgi:hypothetical protein